MKTKVEEITEKVGHAVRENVAHIIFAAVILLMAFISFVKIGVGDGLIDWFGLLINVTLELSVFVPYRWRQKRRSAHTDPYKTNSESYSQKVKEMHDKNELTRFSEFCRKKTAELKRERQLAIVHAAGIDTVTYDFLTSKALPEERGKERDALMGELTDKQRNALDKAANVKIKPVNPLCITSNSSHVNGYGIEFNEGAEDVKGIAGKIFPLILWGVILSIITFIGIADGGIQAVVMIIFRVVMCLSAMFSGIMSGDGFIVKKNKVLLCRMDFIELFHEWLAAEKCIVAQPITKE